MGAANSWGEAESQCPVPHYSHWDPPRGVPGAQSAPWPGTFLSGPRSEGWAGCGVPRRAQSCWWSPPCCDSGGFQSRVCTVVPGHLSCPSLPGTVTHPTGTSSTSWGPHTWSPVTAGAWGTQTGHHGGVQGHLGLGGSLRGSRSRARSSPGPSCPPCPWPQPGLSGPAGLAGSSQAPASLGVTGPWPPQQCPHGLLSPLFNIPLRPVNITIYLSFIY